MRISDWSSDVCSSDLRTQVGAHPSVAAEAEVATAEAVHVANEAEPCRDIVDAVVGKAADQHGVGREPVETGVETLDLIERTVKIDCGPGGAGRGHTENDRPQAIGRQAGDSGAISLEAWDIGVRGTGVSERVDIGGPL